MRRTILVLGSLLCGVSLLAHVAGCAAVARRTPVVRYPLSPPQRQEELAVFLPGRGGTRFDFERQGLLDTLRNTGLPLDVAAIHMPFVSYMDRSLYRRMDLALLRPAADSGYRRFWLIGNSMGGLGSLLYAMKNPDLPIEAIVLVGPFLGDEPILGAIDAAGGLMHWQPRNVTKDDYQRDVWLYLRRCLADTTGTLPRIYLLAGRDDRLNAAHRLLAGAMAADRVFWAAGGHDWDRWRTAFGAFVARRKPAVVGP